MVIKIRNAEDVRMIDFLGRPIGLYLKDGQEIPFKPLEIEEKGDPDNHVWKGVDDLGHNIAVKRKEVDFISHF